MTEIYLIRHSEKIRNVSNVVNDDSFQLCNEKIVLSVNGEMLANELSKMSEMQGIDAVFASNYVRAIGTAKYIAYRNNVDIKVLKDFGERVYGIDSLNDIISGFEKLQWDDIDYKISKGESRREVTNRMYKAISMVLNDYKGKRVCIVSHGTAISFLLSKWCDVFYNDNKTRIAFNDKVIFDGNFTAPIVFKLVFDNDKIVSIKNIKSTRE